MVSLASGSVHHTTLCPMDTLASQLYTPASHEMDSPPTADLLPGDTTSAALLSAIHNECNLNLTANQLELLAWHWKFHHLSMNDLQHIIHHEQPLDAQDTMDTY
eukprot:4192542-Ditylum_brightwellii.AAC.1